MKVYSIKINVNKKYKELKEIKSMSNLPKKSELIDALASYMLMISSKKATCNI